MRRLTYLEACNVNLILRWYLWPKIPLNQYVNSGNNSIERRSFLGESISDQETMHYLKISINIYHAIFAEASMGLANNIFTLLVRCRFDNKSPFRVFASFCLKSST